MPTYIRRVQTVVSFQQFEEDAHTQHAASFGPTSYVAECPGHSLAMYTYAPCPPPKRKYKRVDSFIQNSVAIVPDSSSR